MNYTEALEFFVENGISLNEEQLENLKEESAFTRHMINKTNEWIDCHNAYKELNGRSGKNIDKLKSELGDKMDSIDRDNQYANIHPTSYPIAVYGRYDHEISDARKEFNRRANNAHPENTKGKNDHKTAGDYLAMQKAKNALKK